MLATLRRSKVCNGAAFCEVGQGEPLVLIHGVGMRLEAWAPQMEFLSATHRVIALDMPGHGESVPLPNGSRLPEFVRWLGDVLDAMELEQVNLAGHSMGALISGGAAASFGSRIKRVALLNSVHRRSADARAAVTARARAIEAGGQVDFEGPLRRWFGDAAGNESAYMLTQSWLSSMDPSNYAVAYTAFATGDETYADIWPNVACPALFVTGSDDPNSTPSMSKAMAAAAPRGEWAIIEGHRHMVNLTAPNEVNRLLADWLQR